MPDPSHKMSVASITGTAKDMAQRFNVALGVE